MKLNGGRRNESNRHSTDGSGNDMALEKEARNIANGEQSQGAARWKLD